MGYSGRVARAFLESEARGQHRTDIDEVIGNDSETHPTTHARVTFMEAAAESVASLEHADARVLFTFFKKANVGSGPIRTGIDRTTLDPNDPSTRWLNAAALTIPGQYDLGSAATFYGDFRNPPVLDERIAIQKRMRFPVRADRS